MIFLNRIYGRARVLMTVVALMCGFGVAWSEEIAAAAVYEPFDYPVGVLGGQNGGTGFDGPWICDIGTMIDTASLSYGSLETSGNKIGGLQSQNRYVGARGVSTGLTGMLTDGGELWFSVILGYGEGNATNTTLAFALATKSFSPDKYTYQVVGTAGDNGLGVFMGRFDSKSRRISAAKFSDTTSSPGRGFSGIVYGDASGVEFEAGPRLVVGRFHWGANEDTLTVYLPDKNLNLGSAVSALSVNVDQTAYNMITAARGEKVVMDEIRFGASYQSVISAVTIPDDYEKWAAGYPGADLSDPTAAIDKNGLTNNEKRIWGLDPTVDNSLMPIIKLVDSEAGIFSYRRRNSALLSETFVYQWSASSDQGDWTTFAPLAENASGESPVETVEIQVPAALLKNTVLYVRVVVEAD